MYDQIKLTYVMQWIAAFTIIAAIGVGYWEYWLELYTLVVIDAVCVCALIALFIWQGRIRRRLERLPP